MGDLEIDMGTIGMLGSLEAENKSTFDKVRKMHEPDIAYINNAARVIDPTKIMEELKSIDPELVNEFLTKNGIAAPSREVDVDLSKISSAKDGKEDKSEGHDRED